LVGMAPKGRFPPCQDLSAKRSEWLLMGAGFKIANVRNGGAKRTLSMK